VTSKTQAAVRQPEQQTARKQYAALAAHYGAIGNAAVRAALQFRKPAKTAATK
jgi:hypothetical protein